MRDNDPDPDRQTQEEWRPVPGFPRYQVSDHGRVRSLVSGLPRIKAQHWIGIPARLAVTLARPEGGQQNRTVHTLVALAFIGPRPPGMQVCHGDGRPENNTPANLRYDTAKANAADRERHGRTSKGEGHAQAKLTGANVLEIRARLAAGETATALAREFGVAHLTIQRAGDGRTWRHVPTPPAPNREAKRAARLATQETANAR